MTTFDDRESAFEAKFASDEERRDRKLAEWIGPQLGLSGDPLADYVAAVWRADLQRPGDQDVFEKVLADVQARGVALDGAALRAKMDALLAEARRELHDGV